MGNPDIPKLITNRIGGVDLEAGSKQFFTKVNPATGAVLCKTVRSGAEDINLAVQAALKAQKTWGNLTPVRRGEILHDVAMGLQAHQSEMAHIVSLETGKSIKDGLGETQGAIQQGFFMAGEGQRLYGRTLTSGIKNKYVMTVRQPLGIAGLIIAANTPIANVAWKVFPALICGNSAVLKAAEDAPVTAWYFANLAESAGLPPGVLNVVQGYGEEAGAPLVAHQDVKVISFTGSTSVGRKIAEVAGKRLARISLELGGKNPLVVCDDADLDNALKWSVLSAFSNAGQRCASASRIIVFDSVYDEFTEKLVTMTNQLKVGTADADDFGPVINETQLNGMLEAIERARKSGARILCGGQRLTGPKHKNGYYLAPTLIDYIDPDHDLSVTELFGPIACLYRVPDFSVALELANRSPYGLTAAIHTRNVNRALEFSQKVQAGVANVNGGTYGSEPHMPFGGAKNSGNGTREPGTEALDVYSTLKNISFFVDSGKL